jgi:hypothetical protein
MKTDHSELLRLAGQLPARLSVGQIAILLNCQPHDVPVLVAARLLKPLGTPRPNSVKFFATVTVLERMRDEAWLGKVTNALSSHWLQKNQRKKGGFTVEGDNDPTPPVDLAA